MMKLFTAFLLVGSMLCCVVPLGAMQQAPSGQGEFVPVEQLPTSEQLPAAPLLIAAYAFVWVATLAYVWSVWRRLGRVERELHDLERRRPQRSGGA